MSEYFKSLDSIARSRYLEKLSLLGLTEKDDTYFNTVDKFEDDLRSWPPVEFGHIFCYYLECPRVYTRQQLLQWKSLDGYNYFVQLFCTIILFPFPYIQPHNSCSSFQESEKRNKNWRTVYKVQYGGPQ